PSDEDVVGRWVPDVPRTAGAWLDDALSKREALRSRGTEGKTGEEETPASLQELARQAGEQAGDARASVEIYSHGTARAYLEDADRVERWSGAWRLAGRRLAVTLLLLDDEPVAALKIRVLAWKDGDLVLAQPAESPGLWLKRETPRPRGAGKPTAAALTTVAAPDGTWAGTWTLDVRRLATATVE